LTEKKTPSVEDRKRMSFRAAEGGTGLPAALQWGQLDNGLRLQLWDAFHELLVNNLVPGNNWFDEDFWNLLARILRTHANVPIDEATQAVEFLSGAIETFKPIVLEEPYSEVLDLIQCTLRESQSQSFTRRMIGIFADPLSPYDLVGPPPTIVPRGLDVEGASLAEDLRTIEKSGLRGARSHLLAAAGSLNRGRESGCHP
jgi:hypothetical protein